jgi:hypothetical protein
MKNLTKEKRDKLVIVGLASGFLLVGIWQFLIVPEFEAQNQLRLVKEKTRSTLRAMENGIKSVSLVEHELALRLPELEQMEIGIGSGDPPLWSSAAFDLIRHTYTNVEFLSSSQVVGPETNRWSILPEFPYKQVAFAISGRAYYAELGRFVAEFENQFPTMRLMNFEISAVAATPANIPSDRRSRTIGNIPGPSSSGPSAASPAGSAPDETPTSEDSEKLSFSVQVVALFRTDRS